MITINLLLATTFVTFVINSIALCLYDWFSHKFEDVGIVTRTSYTMAYNILKYACCKKSAKTEVPLHTGRIRYQVVST